MSPATPAMVPAISSIITRRRTQFPSDSNISHSFILPRQVVPGLSIVKAVPAVIWPVPTSLTYAANVV
jgi:hypothetical protein